MLVVSGSWDALRRHGANGDPLLLDSGQVRERAALATLGRNGWFEGISSGMELRIKLGPKAKKLREGKRAAATP